MKNDFDMSWKEARFYVLREFGEHLDGEPEDDPCFYCPECEEPLYKEDFPYFKMSFEGAPICPICEAELR